MTFTQRPPGVPSVEDQPCDAGTTHTLRNSPDATTTCEHCGATWAHLDAELRAQLPERKKPNKGRQP
jgi:hypothetical protein